ncbi:hypothetical protein [Desertivirga xinjiangensis]|uniref:hypothetical protein n=1 Tax=Desertivirga xinjiangensis TaxID=539206 RepID=UPI00210D37F4|nr:hypothetical protein [Pedobacter xinjiangensis]
MTVDEYKKLLFHPKTDKHQLVSHLKAENDFNKIVKIYKHISKLPFIKSLLASNINPKTYNQIRVSKGIPPSGSFIGEVTWNLIVFEQYADLLRDFTQSKENFERELLLANYEKAEQLLNKIDLKFGKSLWLIENLLILKELKDGVNENWNVLSQLSITIQNPLILFFLENLSKKAESKISYFRYKNIFNNQVDEALLPLPIVEYLFFRLNYNGYADYTHYESIVAFENEWTLIDKYLHVRDVIIDIFSRNRVAEKDLLLPVIEKLTELFPDDSQLNQIKALDDPRYINRLTISSDLENLIDQYTLGNFDYCIEHGLSYLLKEPTIIEAYEIYAKSLVEKGIVFPDLPATPLIQGIIEIFYKALICDIDFEQVMDSALKLSTTFGSCSWAKQLLSFVKSASLTQDSKNSISIAYIINSQVRNPRILNFSSPTKIQEYHFYITDSSQNKLETSTTLIKNILQGNCEEIVASNSYDKLRKQVYVGRALINANHLPEAKAHYENLISRDEISISTKEEALSNLFNCYLHLEDLENACKLYVSYFLNNPQITKRLDKERLLAALEKEGIETLGHLIEIPIFYKITSSDPYQQYVAYDTYLEGLEITRPSQLIEQKKKFSPKDLFFLSEVCSTEIMHYSYHFIGTDDLEDERLFILNNLIAVDFQNEDKYIKELSELNQNAQIRRAIREVNKGRISVNIQQLRNAETANLKEAFARFKEIESFSKNRPVVGIDSSINLFSEINQSEDSQNKIVYTSDPAFISFKVILLELRDKFILSKEFGLDGYLSTRIRHGTLLNHIRSIFEAENIISQRDKEGNYLENDLWNIQMPHYISDKGSEIQKAIKRFSRAIDEYTDYIIRELLQVKTEKYNKKPNALFDYSLGNQEIGSLFTVAREDVKEYNFFISWLLDFLQKFTEKVLSKIRDTFNNEIKNNFNQILQDFNTEVKEIIGNTPYPELTTSINLCGTRLQNELRSISEWFYLSSTSKDLELDIRVLIQTAIQITNAIYPNYQLNPKIVEKYDPPLVGTIHLIYICRILLDNIIKHAQLISSELNVEIDCELEHPDLLKLTFRNNLSADLNKQLLINKLIQVKEKWKNESNDFENVNIEGDSGFDKIRRIIVVDLACENYSFDFSIDKNVLSISISIDFINVLEFNEDHENFIN